ncbi:MAG: ABC transporter permease [Planctomycetota bacterium]
MPSALEAPPSNARAGGLPPRAAPKKEWVIEPRTAGAVARAREMWNYRFLFRYFAARMLEKTYARTALGRLWIFIRPLFPVLVNTLVFGGLIGVSSGEVPYFLFFLAGIASWQLFDQSIFWATRSLELNRKFIKRLYFPRMILPLASVAPALVECLIYLGLILIAAGYYYLSTGKLYLIPGVNLLLAFVAMGLSVALAVGMGLWTSVIGAYIRDVRFTLRYVLSFWFFLTPVIYPSTYIPEKLRWLVALNPMATLVETFRWGTLGIGEFRPWSFLLAIGIIVVVSAGGAWYFAKAEAASVDKL